jgi:hypothetical protein
MSFMMTVKSQAFVDGVEAHAAGKSEDANPYSVFSSANVMWDRGFRWHVDGLQHGLLKPEQVKPAPSQTEGGGQTS